MNKTVFSFLLVILIHALQLYFLSDLFPRKEKKVPHKIVVVTKHIATSTQKSTLSSTTEMVEPPPPLIQKILPPPPLEIKKPTETKKKNPQKKQAHPQKKTKEVKTKQVLKKIDPHLATKKEKKKRKALPAKKEVLPHLKDVTIDETVDRYFLDVCDLFKNTLVLPEKGVVKLTISVQPNGKIAKINLVSAESEKNLEYLLDKLRELILPKSQDGKDVVFTITFSDE